MKSPDIPPHTESITFRVKRSYCHGQRISRGLGGPLLIAFHGYGERGDSLKHLADSLPENYILYTIDLPLHGKSHWRGRIFKGEDFVKIFEYILAKEAQAQGGLLGFSFGGRVALYITEALPQKVNRLILVAPDGIVVSAMYRLFQRVPDFVKFLSFRMLSSKITRDWAKKLHKRGWLGNHNYRFVERQCGNRRRRRRLLMFWLSLRHIKPDWKKVRTLLDGHHIKTQVFLATRDEVIPTAAGRLLTEGIKDAEVIFMNANHLQLRRVFLKKIGKYF